MKRKRFIIPAAGCLIAAAALILSPAEAVSAGRDGVTLCLETVIPSLFPFFVLSGFVVRMNFAQRAGRFLSPVMRPVFGVSGAGAVPLILGFVGDTPRGQDDGGDVFVRTVQPAGRGKNLLFSNTGPAFIIGVAGAAVFRSVKLGFILYGCHIAAALLTGLVSRIFRRKSSAESVSPVPAVPPAPPASSAFTGAVVSSVTAILNVCGFVVLLTVIIRLMEVYNVTAFIIRLLSFTGLSPVLSGKLIAGFIELTTGIWSLSDISSNLTFSFTAAAFMLGWGGLAVHCQAASFLSESSLPVFPYICGKLVHGIISAVIARLALPLFAAESTFAFYGHTTKMEAFFDYLGLYVSAACFAAWLIFLTVGKIKSARKGADKG